MSEPAVVDLSAESPPSAKRPRQLTNLRDVRSIMAPHETVDLTTNSPPSEASLADRLREPAADASAAERSYLWGEIERDAADAPPRWRASRRRTALPTYRAPPRSSGNAAPSGSDAVTSGGDNAVPMDVDMIDLNQLPDSPNDAACPPPPPPPLAERLRGRPSLSFLYGRDRAPTPPLRPPPVGPTVVERQPSEDPLQRLGSSHLQQALEAMREQREALDRSSSQLRSLRRPVTSASGSRLEAGRSSGELLRRRREFSQQASTAEGDPLADSDDAMVARRLQQEEELAAMRAAAQARIRSQSEQMARQDIARTAALQRRIEALDALQRSTLWQQSSRGGDDEDDDDEAFADPFDEGLPRRRIPFSHQAARRGLAGPRFEPASLQQLMMGMVEARGDGGGPGYRMMAGRGVLDAMRQAMAGMSGGGRLPPHLLFSDRDFNENDYEALLALDEGIENRRGASKEQIDGIPTLSPSAAGASAAAIEQRCAICLGNYEAGDTLRRPKCGHAFHRDCLDTWLASKAVCPICQQNCC